MKKLINEARRMQQLAGLIKESQLNENQEIEINLEDVEEWDFSEPDEVMFVYDIQSSDSHPNMSWADNRIKFGLSIDNVKNLLYNQSKVQEKMPLEPYGIEDKNIDWVINLDKKTAEGIMDSYYGNYPDENPENLNEDARRLQQLAGLIKENEIMGMDEEEYDNMVDTVKHTLKTMSPEQFTELITSLGELDIWEMGLEQEGIDGINNIEDRMNTVDMAFEDEDYKKYYDKLKELNLI